jgi:hypothetical protein
MRLQSFWFWTASLVFLLLWLLSLGAAVGTGVAPGPAVHALLLLAFVSSCIAQSRGP